MADITDPLPADCGGIDGRADALDSAMRLQVAMSVRECGGRVVVGLSGEVDAVNAEGIGALIATVAARVPWLIVDLTGLKFIDCAGIQALAAAAGQARRAGGGLVLAAPAPLVRRVLDLTGWMIGFPVCSTVEKAAEIASPQPAARSLAGQNRQAHTAALPAVRPTRQQEEGQRDPHQEPTMADTRPDSW